MWHSVVCVCVLLTSHKMLLTSIQFTRKVILFANLVVCIRRHSRCVSAFADAGDAGGVDVVATFPEARAHNLHCDVLSNNIRINGEIYLLCIVNCSIEIEDNSTHVRFSFAFFIDGVKAWSTTNYAEIAKNAMRLFPALSKLLRPPSRRMPNKIMRTYKLTYINEMECESTSDEPNKVKSFVKWLRMCEYLKQILEISSEDSLILSKYLWFVLGSEYIFDTEQIRMRSTFELEKIGIFEVMTIF